MSLEKVQQALIQQLVTSFPTWVAARIAWENKAFVPPAATAWLAVHFMPAGSQIATLGTVGQDREEGLLQVTLAIPAGAGEGDSRATINLLRTCYKPGVLQYGGQPVTILSRSRAGGGTSEGFYKIPFTVRWRAHLTR